MERGLGWFGSRQLQKCGDWRGGYPTSLGQCAPHVRNAATVPLARTKVVCTRRMSFRRVKVGVVVSDGSWRCFSNALPLVWSRFDLRAGELPDAGPNVVQTQGLPLRVKPPIVSPSGKEQGPPTDAGLAPPPPSQYCLYEFLQQKTSIVSILTCVFITELCFASGQERGTFRD